MDRGRSGSCRDDVKREKGKQNETKTKHETKLNHNTKINYKPLTFFYI